MLSVVEKVIFLQNVDVFAEVPTEQLATLATIAEEVNVLKGDVIYRENEYSDALYLVLDGRVRLHQADREITVVAAREAFGTWALFDEEVRLVTATAEEDSHLLCLNRDDFVDLLADHVQIAQGVLKTVARRLRIVVDKISVSENKR